ncbi:hypothetical protein [Paenibacillus arenilitoris]|uniref:Uncharacterized protein n=1 Tax=Paenibacillus arenilitoris TaxID=2772299 RepID=A0A927H5A6_9BACL|nr:hypothetical protein [Paenibacillus arenilitoris]MBD2869281.1 hypothetical protein [Paenibacillus arenilitoris]
MNHQPRLVGEDAPYRPAEIGLQLKERLVSGLNERLHRFRVHRIEIIARAERYFLGNLAFPASENDIIPGHRGRPALSL